MNAKQESTRKFSAILVDGADRAPNRSMLRAVGFKDDDFKKPIVGIASTWSMVTQMGRESAARTRTGT